MNAYIYQGDIYCAACAAELKRDAKAHGFGPDDDSDAYPHGPYIDGGGEADCPQYCGQCGTFLENPLTDEGRAYVKACRDDSSCDGETVREWLNFYNLQEPQSGERCPVCDDAACETKSLRCGQ